VSRISGKRDCLDRTQRHNPARSHSRRAAPDRLPYCGRSGIDPGRQSVSGSDCTTRPKLWRGWRSEAFIARRKRHYQPQALAKAARAHRKPLSCRSRAQTIFDFDQGNRNTKCLLGYNNEAAPRQGAAFLFMLFARQADSAEPCARSTSLCSLRFLLGLLFHDALPCCWPSLPIETMATGR